MSGTGEKALEMIEGRMRLLNWKIEEQRKLGDNAFTRLISQPMRAELVHLLIQKVAIRMAIRMRS